MSTDATAQAPVAAPAAPAPAATPAPAAVAPVETQTTQAPSSDGGGLPMDAASIDAFFQGRGSLTVPAEMVEGGAAAAAPAPTTATTAAPVTATPAEGAKPPTTVTPEPGKPAEQVDENGERILPGKIPTRGFSKEDQRAIDLQFTLNKKGEVKPGDPGFVSLIQAAKQLEDHDIAAGSKVSTTEPVKTPAQLAEAKVTELREKLATLRTERSNMAQDEKFYGPDLDAKNTEIEDAIAALSEANFEARSAKDAEARQQAAQQQQAESSEKTARRTALENAEKAYPGVRDVKTPIGAEAAKLYQEMAQPGHPDHAMLHSVNAAMFLARTAAERVAEQMVKDGKATDFGAAYASLRGALAPVTTTPAASAAPPANPIPPKVSPVAGGATSVTDTSGQPQLTEAQILQQTMDNPELADQILYGGRRSQFVIGA